MDVRPATDADRDAWQAFLGAATAGDFLHDWAWAEVAAFDGQPQRRYLLEDGGAVHASQSAKLPERHRLHDDREHGRILP